MYASKSPPISVVPKCQEEDSDEAAWGPRFGGSGRSVRSPASEPGWSRRFASVDLDEWGAATYAPRSSHELTDPFDASCACDANGTAWDNYWECDSVATDTSSHGQAAEDIAIYRSSSTGHRYPVVMSSSKIGSSGQRSCQWDDPCSPAAAAAAAAAAASALHAPHSASCTARHGSGPALQGSAAASPHVPHAALSRDDRPGASLPPPARQGSGSAQKQQLVPTHKRSHSAAPHSAAPHSAQPHSHPSHPGHGSLTRYLPHLEIPGQTGQVGQTVSLSANGHRKTHSHSAALHGNTTHPGQLGQLSHTTHPGRLTPLDLPGLTSQASQTGQTAFSPSSASPSHGRRHCNLALKHTEEEEEAKQHKGQQQLVGECSVDVGVDGGGGVDGESSDSDDDFIGLYAAVVRSRAGAGSTKARAGGMNIGAGTGSLKAYVKVVEQGAGEVEQGAGEVDQGAGVVEQGARAVEQGAGGMDQRAGTGSLKVNSKVVAQRAGRVRPIHRLWETAMLRVGAAVEALL
ncbi:unnamed protein product [Closterium sp. NIES-65]|nr:unnamed protein product [Closterium sp. NIES-65]